MTLLRPLQVGNLDLPNRVVMAPMTRARSSENHAPNDLVAEYYAQRASAGLLITEASSVSRLSVSRPGTSAIHQDVHAEGWRRVAEQVHGRGGRIFQQLYHMGRKADPTRLPEGERPVAPSAVRSTPQVGGANTYFEFDEPHALTTTEVTGVVDEFRNAAALAHKAGMDGVEIHGSNGYLIDQFLKDATNQRTDQYGGSIANRTRFLMEVTEAAIGVFGAGRVGVRISPHYRDGGIGDSDTECLFRHVATALNGLGIAYLHAIEVNKIGARQGPPEGKPFLTPMLRQTFKGPLMANSGYSRDSAEAAIASGAADLVSFGGLFIANPDLVERFRLGALLNNPDKATYYVGGPTGYTDYPTLGDGSAADAEKRKQAFHAGQ
jgi:N-ethylmaleimide reductase